MPPAWRAAALLPGARSAWLLASGGAAFFRALRRAPEWGLSPDPVDAYTRRVVEAAAASLGAPSRALLAFEQYGGAFADFVALGREAGLGAPSRLGLLLHPRYGPWMAIRAVVLTARELPETRPLAGFRPCEGCPAPCAAACPGEALATLRFDARACAATRAQDPGCHLRCRARRACVVGPEHAYDPEAEAHHMVSERPSAPGGAC